MSSINTKFRKGFTLVELLVVAPIAILAIAVIVAAMINLVGDALMTQQRNATTYETQDALDQIEQDIRLSSAVMQTSGTMAAYQGSDIASALSTNTGAFTANTTLDGTTGRALILSAYATTTNPTSSARTLVYTNQPGGACPTPYTSNDPLNYMIIYYVYGNTLYRRTAIPSATLCGSGPWQKNSCAPAAASNCATNDRVMATNVSSVDITYYVETTNPYSITTTTMSSPSDNPTSIKVTINTSKNVAGGTINSAMSTYASRLNN